MSRYICKYLKTVIGKTTKKGEANMQGLQEAFKMIQEGISRIEKIVLENKQPGRFIDNIDNTVTDSKTGLIWIKDHDKVNGFEKCMTWDEAIEACKNLDYAGHKDWRLPTREELESILDLTKHEPAADPIFKAHTDDWYWTSTPCAWSGGLVWCVAFDVGSVTSCSKGGSSYVRPVRSSQ